MYYIEDDVFYMTRGDSAHIRFCPISAGDDDYVMQPGDLLEFTVRQEPTDASRVLISIISTTNRITLRPEDTASLDVGEYSADAQLITASGDVYTIWPRLRGSARSTRRNTRNFILMSEVTMRNE